MSSRMKEVLSNKIHKEELKPGDHIYSWRLLHTYAHHGIYIGDGRVIHFTRSDGKEIGAVTLINSSSSSNLCNSPCTRCGEQSKSNGVISSCLDCFLSEGNLYRFEYGVSRVLFLAKIRGGTCTCIQSGPSEGVLHRAKYLLENGFGAYNLFENNCECFAMYCKTGMLLSGQVASFQTFAGVFMPGLAAGFVAGFGVAAVVSAAVYCDYRIKLDIGSLPKIPVEKLVALSGSKSSSPEHKP